MTIQSYFEGIATCSDENEPNHSHVNTKLFCSSLDLKHKNEDAPVGRSDTKAQCYCFATEPMVLLKKKSRFPFFEIKNHTKFTTLQNKYIVLIINKYKLLSTIFYLNNKK